MPPKRLSSQKQFGIVARKNRVKTARLMPLVCPICKAPAQQLPSIDATAFRCVIHNNFKVADAVLQRGEEYTRVQWELALRKARERAEPGHWPVIRRRDF
jgi:hypothetical protein